MMLPFRCVVLLAVATSIRTTDAIGTQTKGASKTHDKEKVVARTSRRVKNLDHWDAQTLTRYVGLDLETCSPLPSSRSTATTSTTEDDATSSMYVDEYIGVDAVILFYASWCQNCHALAPLYDQLAEMIQAGTKESNIIMALFDCEVDLKHQDICTAAGVTHYPTLMFVGRDTLHQSLTTKERKLVSKNKNPFKKLRRTTKFRGNWQYGQEILDWIHFNHAWSNWKTLSYDHPVIRFLRNTFTLPFFRATLNTNPSRQSTSATSSSSKLESLPVGVPQLLLASSDQQLLTKTEAELDKKTKYSKQMEKAATHVSLLLDSLLLPTTTTTTSSTESNKDVFQEILAKNVYARVNKDPNDNEALILRSCVEDLSVDYCNRLMVHVVNDDDFISTLVDKDYGTNKKMTVEDIETSILQERDRLEPFCSILDDCIVYDFAVEKCQPATCPFTNPMACQYVSTCLDPQIYGTYMNELGILADTTTTSTSSSTSSAKTNSSKASQGSTPAFLL